MRRKCRSGEGASAYYPHPGLPASFLLPHEAPSSPLKFSPLPCQKRPSTNKYLYPSFQTHFKCQHLPHSSPRTLPYPLYLPHTPASCPFIFPVPPTCPCIFSLPPWPFTYPVSPHHALLSSLCSPHAPLSSSYPPLWPFISPAPPMSLYLPSTPCPSIFPASLMTVSCTYGISTILYA